MCLFLHVKYIGEDTAAATEIAYLSETFKETHVQCLCIKDELSAVAYIIWRLSG